MLKKIILKFTPKFALSWYHYCLARLACYMYGHPTEKNIVIGVTGTCGKSTTVYLLDAILREAEHSVGVSSTIYFRVGHKEWLNAKKMTMPGRFQTFQLLKDIKEAGCKYVIMETTSEGIVQHRHVGINYDLVLFTNLSPEHIDSHGSFKNYKEAKGKLFTRLSELGAKRINGREIKKTIVANVDSEHAKYFLDHKVPQKIGFGLEGKCSIYTLDKCIEAGDIRVGGNGSEFIVEGHKYKINLLGKHNVYNALSAIVVASTLGVNHDIIARAFIKISGIPGRMEFIDEGQDFKVIVDYAFEPKAMKALYGNIEKIEKNKIIHVLGTTGGGRDKARGKELGQMIAQKSDLMVVTDEDPYDDDPEMLMDRVVSGALEAGGEMNKNLFKVIDRKEAIKKAIDLATTGDIVLITGKGSEQAMVVKNNKKIPWDDRTIAKECLTKSK